MAKFKTFTREDWMSFSGAHGKAMIAHPDIDHFVGSTANSIDVVADAQGVCVVIFTSEYECFNLLHNAGGKHVGEIEQDEEPGKEQLEIGQKALTAVKHARNHLELIGTLVVLEFEVI